MSWRRFSVLLDRLPEDSEFKTEFRDNTDLSTLPPPEPGKHGRWPHEAMLLAAIFDRLGDLVFTQGGYKKVPPPLPRPGIETANVHPISAEALAYLEYKRDHQGADPPKGWKPQAG